MKNWAWVVAVVVLGMSGCSDESANGDNTRLVDREAWRHEYVPIEAADDALHTEAVVRIGPLRTQMKMALMTKFGGDVGKLGRALAGPLDANKLKQLNLTESEFTGTWYRPSDFVLSFNGNQCTVTVGKPNTRGYTQESFPVG